MRWRGDPLQVMGRIRRYSLLWLTLGFLKTSLSFYPLEISGIVYRAFTTEIIVYVKALFLQRLVKLCCEQLSSESQRDS